MVKKTFKRRDPIAYNMLTSGLYKQRIVKSKKVYNRKKLKNGKELIKNLSHYFFGKYEYVRIHKETILQRKEKGRNYGYKRTRSCCGRTKKTSIY